MVTGPPPLAGVVDLHSHLIPGVDDGSRTLEEAVDGVRRMSDSGVGILATTPHLDASLATAGMAFEARMDAVDRSWERLVEAAGRDVPGVELHRGFEVRIDVPDPDLSDPRMRLAGTSYALIEWPGMAIPPGTEGVLQRLLDQGVRPIIAHPERYSGLRERPGRAQMWREAGALLQVNHGSLVGRYGTRVRANAFTLLREGWVDLLASDFHGRPGLEPHIVEVGERFREVGAVEQLELLAVTNPGRILQGEEPLRVPMLPAGQGLLSRLKELLQGSGF